MPTTVLSNHAIQVLKYASGYHYRSLYVINHGCLRTIKLESVTFASQNLSWDGSTYLLQTESGFTVRTNVHTTLLRGTANTGDSIRYYRLLQISTLKGEVFYVLVHRDRLGDISKKARGYADQTGLRS